MKKIHTSKRIKKLMDERGLKQVDILRLAEPYCKEYDVRLGRNDLSQYLSGKTEPGQEKLYVLAKALNVSEAWLMGLDVPMKNTITITNDSMSSDIDYSKYNIMPIERRRIPMLGKIACGEPIYAAEEFETYIDANSSIKADFCLTAKGDSMINARIFDGDIVFIHHQPDVDNGEIAVVIIDDEATLKRVYKYENRIELRPENPTFPVINYEGEELNSIKILGKAVAFQSLVK